MHLLSRPIDRYSHPSGHTLYATSFLVMLAVFFPPVMWLMLPLAPPVPGSARKRHPSAT